MPSARSKPRTTTARTSGVVMPQPLRWPQKLAARLIYALIRLMALTLRFRWEYHPQVLAPGNHPMIFAAWHNRLSLSMPVYRNYARRRGQPPRLAAIVSASKDGGVVARILELFGAQPVRGSSSRRGAQALVELKTWAARGYDIAFTPDGPRGPRYVVQPGTISLAQLTGRPIVPVSYHLSWKIAVKSWDRFQIPLPFSRVSVNFGEPFPVPRELSAAERETMRQQFENRLRALTED